MKFNELASRVARQEGLKKQVSIGNVREVLRITLATLAKMPAAEVGKLLSKRNGK